MKLTFDKDADALYLELDDSEIVGSEEILPGVVLDYSDTDEVIGIEVLRLSERPEGLDLSSITIKTA